MRFTAGTRSLFNQVDGGNFEITGLQCIGITRGADGLAKPLSTDDKLRNGVFNSMCKKAWEGCKDGARSTLDAESGGDSSKRERIASSRGVGRLSAMIDEDREAEQSKTKSDLESRMATGRAGHARWLERKDATRIKLPPPGTPLMEEMRPQLDCSVYNPNSVKVIKKGPGPLPTDSATIVRRMGIVFKADYAHGIGESDIVKARAALLKEGHVFLENFANLEDGTIDDEARERYRAELASNEALRLRKDGQRDKIKAGEKVFSDWVQTKEASELAQECMDLIPVVLSTPAPTALPASGSASAQPVAPAPQLSAAAAAAAAAAAVAADRPTLGRAPTEDEHELWRAVGYACKAIDRTLASRWMAWSSPLFSRSDCMKEWATFRPLAVTRGEKVTSTTPKKGKSDSKKPESPKRRPSTAPSGGKHSSTTSSTAIVVGAPRSVTDDVWTAEDREAALQLLRMLSMEHKRLAELKLDADSEAPPTAPVLRRQIVAETMPAFLHGHEGSIHRVQHDLSITDGLGIGMLAGTGVGSELVLQWFVGENDVDTPPPLGVAAISASREAGSGVPEAPEKLMSRLASADGKRRSAAQRPRQPPYVIVLETCGIAGSKQQRDGEWSRVLIDPPEPMPILSSAPGSTHVPISAMGQGLGKLPPLPGETNQDWEKDSRKMRGCVRLSGLLPNTAYCYRVRAYNRIGASSYAFGAFTTALAPPPAPIVALPFLIPRSVLSGAASDTAPPETGAPSVIGPSFDAVSTSSLTICWERRVDLRVNLMRFLRVFYFALAASSDGNKKKANGNGRSSGEIDDDGGNDRDDMDGGLYSSANVARNALLSVINREAGLRNWLGGCVASPDDWPLRSNAPNEDVASSASGMRSQLASTRPITVLEALVTGSRPALTWSSVASIFADDAEADDLLELMLTGTPLAPPPPAEKISGVLDDPDGKPEFLGRRPFTMSSGALSMQSKLAHMTRKAHTLSRNPGRPASADVKRRGSTSGLLNTTTNLLGNTSTTGGMTMRPSTASVRPSTNETMVGSATTALEARRGSVGGSITGSMLRGDAPRVIVRSDVGARFSLMQCVSDGRQGQEWTEVYVGTRSLRRIDKLLPSTSYTFRVQAINGDGQGSLFGPQCYVTTAMSSPGNLRTTGRLTSNAVTVCWDPVSAENPLSTMRAISGGDAPKHGEDGDGGTSSPSAAAGGGGADIDAVLSALLQKTQEAKAAHLASLQKDALKGKGGDDKQSSSAAAAAAAAAVAASSSSAKTLVPIREGDGGYGVDLGRVWARYDTTGSGKIATPLLRGLMADLGGYFESSSPIVSGTEGIASFSAASTEGASSAGPGEWRAQAAINRLDAHNSGFISYKDFLDWWNAADAAREKALAVRSGAGSVMGGTSAAGRKEAERTAAIAIPGSPGAIIEGLGAAVVYVLEARRRLSPSEISAAIAKEHQHRAGGGFATEDLSSARPPRSVLTILSTAPGAEPLPRSCLTTSFSPWTAVYVGPQLKFKAMDLLPNSEYQFRCTCVGRHAFSSASPSLMVFTPPISPFAPVPILVTPRSCAVRFYPGEQGADKFEVQIKVVETMLPTTAVIHGETDRLIIGAGGGVSTTRGAGASAQLGSRLYTGRNVSESHLRQVATARADGFEVPSAAVEGEEAELWQEDPYGSGWTTLFVGASTSATLAGLSGNTVYRCRVVAYNMSGVASRPSVESQFVTPDSSLHEKLTPSNAGRHFVVECGSFAPSARSTAAVQDIVAGDVILFTEDVFVDSAPDPDPYHPAARKEVPQSHPRAHFLCSRTIAATLLADTASGLTTGSGASANLGGPGGPTIIGMTAAALAAHDVATHKDDDATSYISAKTGSVTKFAASRPSSVGSRRHSVSVAETVGAIKPPETIAEAASQRILSLQIEWCTVSIARAGPYTLPLGAIVKRKQSELAGLDVWRTMWADEAGRWSISEELKASYDS